MLGGVDPTLHAPSTPKWQMGVFSLTLKWSHTTPPRNYKSCPRTHQEREGKANTLTCWPSSQGVDNICLPETLLLEKKFLQSEISDAFVGQLHGTGCLLEGRGGWPGKSPPAPNGPLLNWYSNSALLILMQSQNQAYLISLVLAYVSISFQVYSWGLHTPPLTLPSLSLSFWYMLEDPRIYLQLTVFLPPAPPSCTWFSKGWQMAQLQPERTGARVWFLKKPRTKGSRGGSESSHSDVSLLGTGLEGGRV